MAIQLGTRRFGVREYQRMIDAGVLAEGEHVELLEGVIVPMEEFVGLLSQAPSGAPPGPSRRA